MQLNKDIKYRAKPTLTFFLLSHTTIYGEEDTKSLKCNPKLIITVSGSFTKYRKPN